ncbi:reverse transcriptase domain-containing protein [Tanacetum coccineum]
MNKEKLLELAKIPLNENCWAMLLKMLPEKLGDPGKFLIPCNFPRIDVCHTLAFLVQHKSYPLSFYLEKAFSASTYTNSDDFFKLILEYSLYKEILSKYPVRALIDVYGEEITLRVDNEAVTFNLDQTTRYSSTNDKSVNRIDIIDAVCEEYAPELLGFPNSSGGNPTPTSEPFTSEFILEEIEAYLKDDSISPEIDHADCNPEEDICLIEKLLNNDHVHFLRWTLNKEKKEEISSTQSGSKYKCETSNAAYGFMWTDVKFLRSKDEAPKIIIKILKQAQVSLNVTIRYLRTDNGTEFLNQTLRNYTKDVGITRNTSTARTPQQNSVVERCNRTLVEAARTMLIFSKYLLFLWAEAVATACTDKAKSTRKTVKTGQTRTQEQNSTQKAGRKLSKSNPSHLSKECHVGLKKAQGKGYFALILLSKEAQAVSITVCQAGNPCELISDPTVETLISSLSTLASVLAEALLNGRRAYNGRAPMDFYWLISDKPELLISSFEHFSFCLAEALFKLNGRRAYNGRAPMDFYWLISDKPELLISSFEHFSFCLAEALVRYI